MPIRRPTRKFVPQTGRRDSRPNVFIQSERAEGAPAPVGAQPAMSSRDGTVDAVATARQRAASKGRPSRSRSEVFTRTLMRELRQIGILTAAVFAVLIVLIFVVR